MKQEITNTSKLPCMPLTDRFILFWIPEIFHNKIKFKSIKTLRRPTQLVFLMLIDSPADCPAALPVDT